MELKEILTTVDSYLYNLKNGIKQICDLIQEGKEYEAINILPQAAEGLQWVDEALNATETSHNGKLTLKEINDFIEEINEALENEDYILVGDIFNYEIIPILEKMHDSIKDYL
nr:hypothetical protein [Clostridium neonatale]